jgi:hypothetical protein
MDEQIDPEKLAAFLDGTLDAHGREEVLRVLASSPEAYESFSEAAAVLAEGDEAHRASGGYRPKSPARSFLPYAWAASIGVAMAGLLFLVPLLQAGSSFDPLAAAASIAVASAVDPSSQPGDGLDAGWPTDRGVLSDRAPESLAFEAGGRTIDLEFAVAGTDTALFATSREGIATLLRAPAGGAPLAERYRSLTSSAGDEERTRLTADLRALLRNGTWFELGAWVESARLSRAMDIGQVFDPDSRALRGIQHRLDGRDARATAVRPTIGTLVELLDGGIDPSETDGFDQALHSILDAGLR